MARPTKLKPHQIAEIKDLCMRGTQQREIAKMFKVGVATISRIVSERVNDMKSVAITIADAKSELKRFDILEQGTINRFADDLVATSNNMAKAAKHMSNVTARFAQIADEQMDRIDSLGNIAENLPHLKSIDAMTVSAGKAAYIPLSLINSNKDLAPKMEEKEVKVNKTKEEIKKEIREANGNY